jgi:hypothetical protein
MAFLLCGFARDSVYVLALPTSLHELRTLIREFWARADCEIICGVLQEINYRFYVAGATYGAHIELYYDLTAVDNIFKLRNNIYTNLMQQK